MIRRIRSSARGFSAISALLLLALPVQASDIEPEPKVEEMGEAGREPDWVVEAEVQEQVDLQADVEAAEAGPSVGSKIFDCAVLRPFGLAATLLGGVFFLPAAVLASPSGAGGVKDAWQIFVVTQVENTFLRPLGAF